MTNSARFHRRLRILLTLCVIGLFTVQSYVLQAHIHEAGMAAHVAAIAPHADPQLPGGRDDHDDCPLCQAFALASAFVAPGSVPIPLPLQHLVSVWRPIPHQAGRKTPQFSWRSRAPPFA